MKPPMKPTGASTDLMDDNDIAKVFEAQSITVPDTLRQSVLLQAEQLSSEQTHNAKNIWSGRTGWLSAAATVVIAVAVAPMLLNTPDTITTTSESRPAPLAPATSAARVQKRMETEMSLSADSVAEDRVAEESIAAEASMDYRDYRTTAAKWMNQIIQLTADGDTDEAREEYRLFELEYPDEAKNFKPDSEH